jgi:hypothetical protein
LVATDLDGKKKKSRDRMNETICRHNPPIDDMNDCMRSLMLLIQAFHLFEIDINFACLLLVRDDANWAVIVEYSSALLLMYSIESDRSFAMASLENPEKLLCTFSVSMRSVSIQVVQLSHIAFGTIKARTTANEKIFFRVGNPKSNTRTFFM